MSVRIHNVLHFLCHFNKWHDVRFYKAHYVYFAKINIDGNEWKLIDVEVLYSKDGTLEKNVYMEALYITTVPGNDLGEFITGYMDRGGEQSEYIGRLVKKDGKLSRDVDEGFMHNFNAKQLRAVKDNPVYAKYIAREEKKKTLQLKKMQDMFKRVPSRARKEALEFVEQAREGKFAQRIKEVTNDFIKDESGYILGG